MDTSERARPFEQVAKRLQLRHLQRLGLHDALRQEPAQLLAPAQQILRLAAVRRRTEERRLRDLLVADRDAEPRPELAQLLFVQLLLLVRDVAALARFAQPVALDRLGQDHRRLALVFHRGLVGGIDLARVVAAAQQLVNLLVGQVIHQLQQLGILAEEMPPRVAARLDGVLLVIAVHRLFHPLEQQAGLVRRQQLVPIRAPDHLDDIPARAPERRFQFLDDLAVAAHRAVQPLQVAVHHPDQVVEVLARRQRQRAQRFRLVRFAVADERPHLRLLAADEPARLQVAVEPRLVNRQHRPQPHRHRRELPEVRHQIRMRIGRQARRPRPVPGGSSAGAARPAALPGTPARKCPAWRAPGNRPCPR